VNFEAEANKFLLFVKEDKSKKHECNPLFNFTPGKFKHITKDPKYSIIPPLLKDFKGRQREMYDLMRMLHDNNLVCLKGIQGMGKSAMLRNFCHHIKHRSKFVDGIVYVDCSDFKEVDEIKINYSNVLFVLDNVDNLVETQEEAFCKLVKSSLNNLQNTGIVVSSRNQIEGLRNAEKAEIELIRLSEVESIRLLLDK
jgi:Cdc6-like AAA superfamily ATPase